MFVSMFKWYLHPSNNLLGVEIAMFHRNEHCNSYILPLILSWSRLASQKRHYFEHDAGQAANTLLSDMYTGFNYGGQQQQQQQQGPFAPSHRLLHGPGQFLPEGSSFAGFQGLRDASQQPWQQQQAQPQQPVSHGLAQQAALTPSGSDRQPQPDGSAWAASLFASPSSTAMSSTPSKEATPPSGGMGASTWLSPLLQQVRLCLVH